MRALLLALGIVLLAPPSHAADMALRWDACGAAGPSLRTFACGTNSGSDLLVVSFVPPDGVTQMNGLSAAMQVIFPMGTPAPSWWAIGGCRPLAALSLAVNPAPAGCVSAWPASAAGGTNYTADYYTTGVSRLQAVAAVPPGDEMALDPSTEYLGFRLSLGHAKSTGTGACTGCSTPAVLYLGQLQITQPLGVGDFVLTPQDRADHRYFASWQCDANLVFDHGTIVGWSFVDCSVGVRPSTWGQIKSLYR